VCGKSKKREYLYPTAEGRGNEAHSIVGDEKKDTILGGGCFLQKEVQVTLWEPRVADNTQKKRRGGKGCQEVGPVRRGQGENRVLSKIVGKGKGGSDLFQWSL